MKDLTKLIRPEISTLTKYVPGKPMDAVQREYGLDEVIKLASNENPLGPSPKARKAVDGILHELHLYPDGGAYNLRHAIARKFNVDADSVVVGSGLDEMLRLIGQTLINPGDEAIMADLTFPIYAHSTKLMGGKAVVVPVKDFAFDMQAMADAINDKTKLVFITNPNNPTGTMITKDELDAFMGRVPDHVLVVLDEAYCEYVEEPDFPDGLDYLKAGHNMLVLRTFSKIYGLASLRLGYAIGPKDIMDALNLMRPVFNASSLAQVAAIAALDDDEHVVRTRENNEKGKQYLTEELQALGLMVVPSFTNFVLVDLEVDARDVFVALQKKGVIIRPSGPPTFARITIGTPYENQQFITALKEVLNTVKEA